jgi:peptidyl-prolyl cis-trans isomerase B (cyclophilin B)
MSEDQDTKPEMPAQPEQASRKVTIDTARGQIVMEVYPDLMPITMANFDKLVNAGFYDGLTFHRVEDWVIQGGDPIGNGTGGPGWKIRLEINPRLNNVRGAVAMARSLDPNSAGSQFYILKKDASWLNGQYAVFGKVVQGMDVVDQVQKGDPMKTVRG